MAATVGPSSATSAGQDRDSPSETLARARSDDLVIALVGHIGAGLDDVRAQLHEEFGQAGYDPAVIKVSDQISELAQRLGFPDASELSARRQIDRIVARQKAGTWLRQTLDHDITASLAVRAIREARRTPPAPGRKRVLLVDSLKHPREVQLLRRVYGSSFYLVSVVSRRESREKMARKKFQEDGPTEPEIQRLLARDEADTEQLGQQVRKTLHLGDYFVDNDHWKEEELDPLASDLSRFVDAVLERTVVRPRRDERGMYAAWAASLRSACLSRQVGAAILDKSGLILATGTNDVPRAGGGLYDEGVHDQRCFSEGAYCRNDATKKAIYEEIFEELSSSKLLDGGAKLEAVRSSIEATTVRDLVEFSRAVHAEMDAIISLARSPGASTDGSTLYCTTYPCHSCARHIVAAGIIDVVYIEPYIKSRAAALHGDAIVETTRQGAEKLRKEKDPRVRFRLFSGVAPRRFAPLFEKRGELKDSEGKLVQLGKRPQHRDAILNKSFAQLEDLIAGIADKAYEPEPRSGA
jgi:deoxycytidylate deaminase